MKRLAILLAFAAAAQAAPPSHCFHEIPVITIAPHQVAGFSWGKVIRPMDDPCLAHVAVEPANQLAWYVGSQTALYMTKDGGSTWTKPLTGQVTAMLLTHHDGIQLVYAAIHDKLFLSRDQGQHWTMIRSFAPRGVSSLVVSKGRLYVGLRSASHDQAGGVWVGNLGAGLGAFKPFGAGHTGLIVWTLAADPASGAVYAGTEIFDHPQPYKPPFFRTMNEGGAWTNIAGALPTHSIGAAVRPDGFIYALLEGQGVWGRAAQGPNWQLMKINTEGIGGALLMDPKKPLRLYIGRHKFGQLNGGMFLSTDGGKTLKAIGLQGATVSDIALNGAGTRLFVTLYGSGLYVAPVP